MASFPHVGVVIPLTSHKGIVPSMFALDTAVARPAHSARHTASRPTVAGVKLHRRSLRETNGCRMGCWGKLLWMVAKSPFRTTWKPWLKPLFVGMCVGESNPSRFLDIATIHSSCAERSLLMPFSCVFAPGLPNPMVAALAGAMSLSSPQL